MSAERGIEPARRCPAATKRRKATVPAGSGGLVALLAAVALVLGACSGPSSAPAGKASSPTVASLGTSTGTSRGSTPDGEGSTTTTLPTGNNPTALVDEWAACERSHGDPEQTDPTIDSHGGINITLPKGGGLPAGDPHDVTGTCSQYLAKAQVELRAEDPVADPQGPDTAQVIAFATCMRDNGVPDYPYPSGPDDSETNFQGTGVNPNSPQVVRVNDLCGKRLGLPAWWINGWGPPGDISVQMSGGPDGNPPACVFSKKGCSGAVGGSNG